MDIFNKPIPQKQLPPKGRNATKSQHEVQEQERKQFLWSTELVHKFDEDLRQGYINDLPSPYLNGELGMKKADIVFDMTEEELEEYKRCRTDIVYFADKYCYAMTDEGVKSITLREYQKRILRAYQDNRFVILLSGRQIGKCVSPTSTVRTKTGTMPLFKVWFRALRKHRKPLPIERFKYRLYTLLYAVERKMP